jgi:hypothetical protein
MEKPEKLYHASSNRSIEKFVPRSQKVRDAREDPRIFATSDKGMSTVCMVGTDDSWTHSGAIDGVPYIIISDKERFTQLDKGGAIYHLPNSTFENDPEKGLRELEWTSKVSVNPIGKEEHESALDAMVNHCVQVYFVDAETFSRINSAHDGGLSTLRSLTSENQLRRVNVSKL